NGKALAAAGIGAATPDPDGGRIVRDAAGLPTGILVDNAADLVAVKVPHPSRAEKTAAVKRAAKECVAAGLTTVHEPGIGLEEIEILKRLYGEKAMPLRVYAMLGPDAALDRYAARG